MTASPLCVDFKELRDFGLLAQTVQALSSLVLRVTDRTRPRNLSGPAMNGGGDFETIVEA